MLPRYIQKWYLLFLRRLCLRLGCSGARPATTTFTRETVICVMFCTAFFTFPCTRSASGGILQPYFTKMFTVISATSSVIFHHDRPVLAHCTEQGLHAVAAGRYRLHALHFQRGQLGYLAMTPVEICRLPPTTLELLISMVKTSPTDKTARTERTVSIRFRLLYHFRPIAQPYFTSTILIFCALVCTLPRMISRSCATSFCSGPLRLFLQPTFSPSTNTTQSATGFFNVAFQRDIGNCWRACPSTALFLFRKAGSFQALLQFIKCLITCFSARKARCFHKILVAAVLRNAHKLGLTVIFIWQRLLTGVSACAFASRASSSACV